MKKEIDKDYIVKGVEDELLDNLTYETPERSCNGKLRYSTYALLDRREIDGTRVEVEVEVDGRDDLCVSSNNPELLVLVSQKLASMDFVKVIEEREAEEEAKEERLKYEDELVRADWESYF